MCKLQTLINIFSSAASVWIIRMHNIYAYMTFIFRSCSIIIFITQSRNLSARSIYVHPFIILLITRKLVSELFFTLIKIIFDGKNTEILHITKTTDIRWWSNNNITEGLCLWIRQLLQIPPHLSTVPIKFSRPSPFVIN